MVGAGYVGRTLGAADLPRPPRYPARRDSTRAHRRAAASGEAKAEPARSSRPSGEPSPTPSRIRARGAGRRPCRRTASTRARCPRRHAPVGDGHLGRDVAGSIRGSPTAMSRPHRALAGAVLLHGGRADRPDLRADPGHGLRRGTTPEQPGLYDVVGHQRGWEILTDGVREPLMELPDFRTSRSISRARRRARGRPGAPLDRPATSWSSPIPTTTRWSPTRSSATPRELDRALKMEMAYAGRSWLLGGLTTPRSGSRRVAARVRVLGPGAAGLRPLRLRPRRHAGSPRRPHRPGLFRGFMNSRQTAAIFGGEPNGH